MSENTNPAEMTPQEKRSSLLSHLLALRKVLIISAAAVVIAFFLVFYLAIDQLMGWIINPIQARGIEIIYTAMSEALVTKFKVALIAAAILASPVVIWQVWVFIKPALYPKEQRSFWLIFVIALLLFLLGVTFCYFAVYTLAVDFFLIQGDGLAVFDHAHGLDQRQNAVRQAQVRHIGHLCAGRHPDAARHRKPGGPGRAAVPAV